MLVPILTYSHIKENRKPIPKPEIKKPIYLQIGTGIHQYYGDCKGKPAPNYLNSEFGIQIVKNWQINANCGIGKLAGQLDIPNQTKDNFEFVAKIKYFKVNFQYSVAKFHLHQHQLSLGLNAGFGWLSARSIANYLDNRQYIQSSTTPNPNFGNFVFETYAGRNWIVPVGLVAEYKLKDKYSVLLNSTMHYQRNDDIDVYNNPVWENNWFDKFVSVNLAFRMYFSLKR